MITSGTSSFMFGRGAVFIVSSVIGACGGCSRAAYLFIGRNGSTHCLHCEHFLITASEVDAADDGPSVQGSFENAII